MMRWGFIPHFAKTRNEGFKHINARGETVATNGIFKNVGMADGSLFCLAAIWRSWTDPATGEVIDSFCIVTCEPNSLISKIHDRMPVILAREDYDRWLGEEPDPADLLKPFPSALMKMWRVDWKVGNSKNDTFDLLDETPSEDLFELPFVVPWGLHWPGVPAIRPMSMPLLSRRCAASAEGSRQF